MAAEAPSRRPTRWSDRRDPSPVGSGPSRRRPGAGRAPPQSRRVPGWCPTVGARLDPINGLLSPGQTVSVTGAGWAPGEFVSVQVCGNDGVNGSADCDVANAESFYTERAEFRATVVVTVPPRPCPCVILAVGALTEAKTPISIAGTTSAPVSSTLPARQPRHRAHPPRPTVPSSKTTAGGPPGSAHPPSAPSSSPSPTPAPPQCTQPFMSVAYGKGDDPRTVIEAPRVPPIEAGQTAVVRVPFELDAFLLRHLSRRGGPRSGREPRRVREHHIDLAVGPRARGDRTRPDGARRLPQHRPSTPRPPTSGR